MDQHQRRIYALAAELGDLEVQKRQLANQVALVDQAIEAKHQDISAAMRIRALAMEGNHAAAPQSFHAAPDSTTTAATPCTTRELA